MTGGLFNSLSMRMIAAAGTAVVIAMLLAGLFISNLYHVHAAERFQGELDHHIDELVQMIVVGDFGTLAVRQPLSDPLFNIPRSGLYWQIEDRGDVLLRSPSLADGRLPNSSADRGWFDDTALGMPVIQKNETAILADGRRIIVSMAAASFLLDEQIGHFHEDLVISMVIVGLLLLLGAMAMVRFGLAPVRALGEEMDRLRHGEIERLDPRVPAEFAPIVERLNGLLDGQAQLIARARTESGNLAHHLRTPLSLIADEAEQMRLAGHERSAGFLFAKTDSMKRHIDYHLARAAAAGSRGAGRVTRVAPLVSQIVEAMSRLHAARELNFRSDIASDMRLQCEEGDLAEIISNIIDNACKWAQRDVVIQGAGGVLEVRDDGPGIPTEHHPAAMAVGASLDPQKPGTGLGLPATRDLMSFYKADLQLLDAPGGGLLVRMAFPTTSEN